jgi:hypothetical protein
MTPTPKLRFIERVVPASIYGEGIGKTVRILQQWWAIEREGQVTPTGEWRDIPLEKET